MGKKKSKKLKGLNFNVTGVTVEQLINMDFKELAKYNEASVKKITSRLVSAYNKRLNYLKNSERGRMSPTYYFFEQREKKQAGSGYYSVKGKGKSTTISLFKTLQDKLKQETSTVKGFEKYQKGLYEDLGLNFKRMTKETLKELKTKGEYKTEWEKLTPSQIIKLESFNLEKKFWEIYNKYTETQDKTTENWKTGGGSPEIMQYILNRLGDWETMSDDEKQAVINKLYEELKITEQAEIDKTQMTESQLFEKAEQDDDTFEM